MDPMEFPKAVEKKEHIALRLPQNVIQTIEKLARQHKTTKTAVIETLIRRALEAEKIKLAE
jgi:predicted transcriptional regulator